MMRVLFHLSSQLSRVTTEPSLLTDKRVVVKHTQCLVCQTIPIYEVSYPIALRTYLVILTSNQKALRF